MARQNRVGVPVLGIGAVRRLREFARASRELLGIYRDGRGREPDAPFLRTLSDLARGYDPLEASWYRQAGQDPARMISTFQRICNLRHANGGTWPILLNDKLVFAHMMRSLRLPHPEVFAFGAPGGETIWLPGGEAALAHRLASGQRIVAKAISGRKGTSVRVCTPTGPEDAAPPPGWIVTAFVRQADYAAEIYPGVLNTVRVFSVSPEPGRGEIVAAAHRFGSGATGWVDNFSRGGLVSRVDLASGQLSPAMSLGPGNRLVWNERHPETQGRIAEVELPHWPKVTALIADLCAHMPGLRYVGWDIAITKDGPVVIEGNARPSLRFFQPFGPLRLSPAAAAFFARYNVPPGRFETQ